MARGTRFIALALVGGALWGSLLARPAQAQNEVAVESGRLFVEFRAATLYDAVQMVQQAVGRTDYEFADETAAKNTLLTTQSFNNAAWDNIIRRVTNDSGFKIVPQPNGKKSIEVRAPVMQYGAEGGYPGGGYPGGAPGFGGQGYSGGAGLPANPFGGGRPGQAQQFANQQTAPGLGTGTTSSEGKDYRVLRVQHVYVGGIAKLFGDADIISTEDFLLPDSALNGGGLGGGNNTGGNNIGGGFGGGGGGGFGGGGGGFGGGGGGFGGGGGGFGGGGGGIGGNIGF